MKKLSIFIVTLLFITPTLVSAAWWNPLTWFDDRNFDYNEKVNRENGQWKKELESVLTSVTATTTSHTAKFYVKHDSTRLRKCASTTCDVKSYYSRNHEITVTGAKLETLSDLEEWLTVTQPDGSLGYLHKSVLSEKPIPEPKKDMHLSDLNSYIDVLISDLEANITYFIKMKESTDFYGNNFEEARSFAIIARDGGTLPQNLQRAMGTFITEFVDKSIETNNIYRNQFVDAIKSQEDIIVALQKKKDDALLSKPVDAEQYLVHYNESHMG